MKKLLLLICSLAMVNQLVMAQQNFNAYLKDNTTYREHALDITKMRVEVGFVAEKGLVIGKVQHHFVVLQKQVDSIFFDAPSIKIKTATFNNVSVPFLINKAGVWVKPKQSLKWDEEGVIEFEYEASPRRGIYFIGWNEKEPEFPNPFAVRKQIWTQGQGIDNRQWIPMYDDMNDKFITETVITFNKDYQVLSNGKLISKKENKDKTVTWHYQMSKPHAGYLLMLAIGKYAVNKTNSANGVALNNWYYPEFADRMAPTYRYTAQMMDFLERETGIRYPWESYSQVMVQDFIFGAMENTTATIFGDFFNVDEKAFLDKNYIGVNCHEMTHQWFGDYITARDPRGTWLQESFATYYPKLFSKEIDGNDEYDWQRRVHQNAAVEAGKKDNYAVGHTAGGTARVYPKGAAVISMLEYVLGKDQWKRALNHYLKTHAYANVETNDMQQAIKDKLGLNLDWFFDQWIYRGGEPHYRVQYEDLTNNGNRVTAVTIEQIHKTDETIGHFKMPVTIEVHYTDGTLDAIAQIQQEAFEVIKINNPLNKKIAFVLFDPNSNIIKQVTFKKTLEELKQQIEKAPNYIDRYDAAVALRDLELNEKRNILLQTIQKEKHYGIVNEIINQLINDKEPVSVKAMQAMLQHPKSVVRENVLNKLNTISAEWKPYYLKALSDSSYDVVKTAMDKLYNNFQDKETIEKILSATENIWGMNNAVKIKHYEIIFLASTQQILAPEKKQYAISQLNQFASSQFEFRTRLLAFSTFKTLNLLNKELCDNLFNAMLSSNSRLAGPATELANYFATQAVYKQLLKDNYKKANFETWQKDIVKRNLNWIE